ncbi:alanine racemase [Capsulimonas corticalis]|uniref:Alanine racemase n=2 Tax=Capsulimonas corticalis TaxID=2219043 RepID=A0A402D5Z1_9BACT|nr:alanine racemase [Capsulimonas corticalis]
MVLTNRQGVSISPDTREKVLAAARELGYRPNSSARAISTGRFGCAAIILSTKAYTSNLPMGLLDGIHDTLADNGMHLNISRLPDEKLIGPDALPKFLREQFVDGLLINYHYHIPETFLEKVREDRIPYVWINHQLDADCVYPDDFQAARYLTERFITRGHRRIAYFVYPASVHYSDADRRAGYKRAMDAGGLRSEIISYGADEISNAECMALLLGRFGAEDAPTAVVAYGPWPARALMQVALRLGRGGPDDLDVATFDDQVLEDCGRNIATAIIPQYAIGVRAVEMLRQKLEAPELLLAPQAIPYTFADGETSEITA